MNRTALSVISLAVGSVLIIGLFNIYKPQTKRLASQVFHRPQVALQKTNLNDPPKGTPVVNTVEYDYHGKFVPYNDGYPGYQGAFKPKGKFGEKNNINWYDFNYNHMPGDWNIKSFSARKDPSENFVFGQNKTVQHVEIEPNPADLVINYVNGNGKVLNSFTAHKRSKIAFDQMSKKDQDAVGTKAVTETVTNSSPNFPKGYHLVNGNSQTIGDYRNTVNINVAK